MSTHALPQIVCVPGHLPWHAPATQSTVPPVGAVHLVHDAPHASTVSPLHADPEVPELPDAPDVPELPPLVPELPLLAPEVPLDDWPPSGGVGVTDGSSPTHAARTMTESAKTEAPTEKMRPIVLS